MTNQTTTRFKSAYDPHPRIQPKLNPKSLTHQSMAPECDINTIMKKYEKTGVLEHRNRFEGAYGDFTDVPSDYHESMNAVIAADEMFSTLPARVRRRFHNDPGAFIDFAANPDNASELVALGLATSRETQVSSGGVIEPVTPPKSPSATPPKAPPKAPPSNEGSPAQFPT